MFDITFKEVDKLTRQAETRAHQLGPSWARQSPVALDCGQAANILFPNDISIAPPTLSVIRIRACVTARSCIRRYQATWGY